MVLDRTIKADFSGIAGPRNQIFQNALKLRLRAFFVVCHLASNGQGVIFLGLLWLSFSRLFMLSFAIVNTGACSKLFSFPGEIERIILLIRVE